MNEIRFTLSGSIRSKKNSKQVIMAGKRPMIIPSTAHKKWERRAREELWLYAKMPPLICPVHIEALFFCKGVLPDLSGAMESLGDCLEGIIYRNDKQIISWDGSRVYHDKVNPRVEVVVRW